MPDAESKALSKHFNSRSRRVSKDHTAAIVPLRYDQKGELLTEGTFDPRKHLKRLTPRDWLFLECWRRNNWALAPTCHELDVPEEYAKRLIKKLDIFRTEEQRDKALAAIPSSNWIQARHVENVFKAEILDDAQRDSLKELAKIQGAYKQANVSIQNNVFNLPSLTAEQEKELKALADRIALQSTAEEGQVVNE